MPAVKKLCLFLALLFQTLAFPVLAASQDYIVERAYFEDETNSLTFAEIKSKPFQVFTGMLAQSYSNSTFWVRIKIAPATKPVQDNRLVLKIQPTYLDEVELFDPIQPQKINRIVGDRHPYANNEWKSLDYDFLIPTSNQARYAWLRLKTTSTNLMQVSVFEEPDARFVDRKIETASAVILSALTVFIIWGLIQWWFNKEHLLGVFMVRQLIGIVFFVAYVGYLRVFFSDYFPPSILDQLFSIFAILSPASVVWFHWVFFKDYSLDLVWMKIFKGVLSIYPLLISLLLLGYASLALRINMTLILFTSFYMFWVCIYAVKWKVLEVQNSVKVMPKSYVIFVHAIYLFVISLTTFPSLGLASGGIFSPHAILLYALVSSVTLVFLVFYRVNLILRKQSIGLVLAEQNALYERAQRQEQGDFLDMLTHEFRNSLSIVKMALARVDLSDKQTEYIYHAVDGMSGVIDRCAQTQILSDGAYAGKQEDLNVVELLDNVIYATNSNRISFAYDKKVIIKTDPILLKLIFSNLIDNALKYSPVDSEVLVKFLAAKDSVSVIVSNQVGFAGVPDRDKVFRKYYRSERAHQQIGSGLGLYLIAKFVERLNGKILYHPVLRGKNSLVEFEVCIKI
jgi:signal transduction histidine kinase